MSPSVLSVDRVTKRFAGHTAVDTLSLDVPSGAIFGLLGPNGAGKTTLIRMVMNILIPDEGTIRLFGQEGTGHDFSERIGFLPEERGLYPKMRVLDVLVFLAEAKGVGRRTARARALDWLDRLGLGDWCQKKVADLSKGMQQKVQFISTMLHEPDLVVLDEPFSGLDPVNTEVLKDTVLDLHRRGKTIVFSTHIMEHAEKLCDQLCIIARGRKLLEGSVAEVKQRHGGRHVTVAFDGPTGDPARAFSDGRLVRAVQDFGQYAELEMTETADPQEVLRTLLDAGARLTRFEVAMPSLHKIFVDVVGPDAAVAAAQPGRGAHA